MAFARKISWTAISLLFAATLTIAAAAQTPLGAVLGTDSDGPSGGAAGGPTLSSSVPLPRMAPELALSTYEKRVQFQAVELGSCTDTVVIRAELPDTAQKGEYELKRYYSAPKNLSFGPLKFVGDTFVKTNVILRLLQSEQDHVENGTGGDMSLTSRNYKITYKGTEILDGKPVHVYHVKPRQKRVGLFKGRIFLDVYGGRLRRVEGTLVRSPSFFVKKVEFVQEYADFGGFTLPVHVHSNAKARIVGRAIVDVTHSDYEPHPVASDGQPVAAPALSSQTLQPH